MKRLLIGSFSLSLLAAWLFAADAPSEDAPLKDQLPRIPPTESAEALKTFQALDGFRMELIAAEPLTTDPVAIAYDEDGRAFVVEMSDYPYTDKSTDVPFKERTTDLPIGRVRILEDTDGDGTFDKSTIFAEKLSWPTGIALYDGGAFVTATPDIWYFKDTNGDGKADIRRQVYTGFRKFNVQAVINNLAWGLDHKIYGAGSSNGGAIRPGDKSDGQTVTISRNDFCFDPTTGKFEAISGGARFGNTFDDWGNRFICSIRNPAQHVLIPNRYLARNPYLPVTTVLVDVAESGDQLPVYRLSPPEPWRVVNARRLASQTDRKAPRSESNAVGFVTSASGMTLYRGTAYPAKYYNNIFLGEVSGNLIHRQVMHADGVTFKSERADENTEFVRSTDNWFRPVNFINAPDGTLHVLDMYRETIEHPWSIPDDIKAHLDLESGRDRGRIYRLAPSGFKPPKPPRLSKATTAELVAQLENRNSWWRETAHRLIYERQDKATVPLLKELLKQSKEPLARLHALWSLEGLKALTDHDLLRALADAEAGVREQAVLLAETRLANSPALLDKILALADDPAPRVRFQVAFTLGEAKDPRVTQALLAIARRDAGDPWMRKAVLSSAEDVATDLLEAIMHEDETTFTSREGAVSMSQQLGVVIAGRNRPGEVEAVLEQLVGYRQRLDPTNSEDRPLIDAQMRLLIGLGDGLRRSRQTFDRVISNAVSPEAEFVKKMMFDAQHQALDTKAAHAAREQAIQLLSVGNFEQVKPTLAALLDARQPQEIQMAAVRAIAGFSSPEVVDILLTPWQTYTPAISGEVVETILSRKDRIKPLLDAVAANKVRASQISATRRNLLMAHPDDAIRQQATSLFGASAPSPRKEVIAQYKSALSLAADKGRGQKIFERECLTCHKLGDKGHDVGPSLATIRHRSPDDVLTHILDPNREVPPNFMQYVVAIDDGRIAVGLIAAETATSLTLKRAEGVQETILRQNIDEISSTHTSLMPEGMEKKIQPQEMADLIAFLLGAK
jgi:putative membrane-bound dehydrogenase-like protein